MNVVDATERYESWVRRHAPLVAADLRRKHRDMAAEPFAFLRATYYRWAQIWGEAAGDLARTPVVLSVGDLHVENFGTWRDAEGRLVWGINDFDEADELPFAADLSRLGVSAVLAARSLGVRIRPKLAAALVLDGYREGTASGGRPFVLEERHPFLRAIAQSRLKDAEKFWGRLARLDAVSGGPPPPARRLLARLLPEGSAAVRIVRRVAGLGSLGRRRFAAVGELQGGFVAREVKELVPAASHWARGERSRGILYSAILARAVRCPDPFLLHRGRWVGRRLSPSNSRIELSYLGGKVDVEKVVRSMGFETANVHGGGARRGWRAALGALEESALVAAIRALESAVERDWKRWRER